MNILAALCFKENRTLSTACCPLIFHGCSGGWGFQIPVPVKQQARFCPQIPASPALELH